MQHTRTQAHMHKRKIPHMHAQAYTFTHAHVQAHTLTCKHTCQKKRMYWITSKYTTINLNLTCNNWAPARAWRMRKRAMTSLSVCSSARLSAGQRYNWKNNKKSAKKIRNIDSRNMCAYVFMYLFLCLYAMFLCACLFVCFYITQLCDFDQVLLPPPSIIYAIKVQGALNKREKQKKYSERRRKVQLRLIMMWLPREPNQRDSAIQSKSSFSQSITNISKWLNIHSATVKGAN